MNLQGHRLNIETLGYPEAVVSLLKTKSLNWQHENEWRSMMSTPALTPITDGSDSRGFPILGKEIPIDCLSEIIFGADMPQEDVDRITGQLPNSVSYFKVKPHLRQCNLDRYPLCIRDMGASRVARHCRHHLLHLHSPTARTQLVIR